MTWLVVLMLALAAFAAAAFILRLPRAAWTIFGAALVFGLAGYAAQGRPQMPAAPKVAQAESKGDFASMIEIRRLLYGETKPPSRFVTMADGYARRGAFAQAADLLNNAVGENPKDSEGWVALGNVLIEHAGGVTTPAASYAYSMAKKVDAKNPAPAYFEGVGQIRMGQLPAARDTWKAMLDALPADAPQHPALKVQYDRLDTLLSQAAAE